jgi:hypothetical protein
MNNQYTTLAKTAYNAIASQMGNAPYDELPEDLRTAWYMAIVQTQIFHDFPAVIEPISGVTARCSWCITGGLIPGIPMPELTRQWAMTSEENEGNPGANRFTWRMFEASHYVQLLHDPGKLNWVNLEWIWY